MEKMPATIRIGKYRLVHNGYLYMRDNVYKKTTYWKCVDYKNKNCKSRVHTVNNKVTKHTAHHDHEPNEPKVKNTISNVEQSASQTTLSTHAAIGETSFQLPRYSTENKQREIQMVSQEEEDTSSSTNETKFIILKQFKKTSNDTVDIEHEVTEFKEISLKRTTKRSDDKMNWLWNVLEAFANECKTIVVLTETGKNASMIEDCQPFILENQQQFIVSIHELYTTDQQAYLFNQFLNNEIKSITLSYDLMESFIQKHKDIEFNTVIAYDLPRKLDQYLLLYSSNGLKIKDGVIGVLFNPKFEMDRKNAKLLVHMYQQDGQIFPDGLLNVDD